MVRLAELPVALAVDALAGQGPVVEQVAADGRDGLRLSGQPGRGAGRDVGREQGVRERPALGVVLGRVSQWVVRPARAGSGRAAPVVSPTSAKRVTGTDGGSSSRMVSAAGRALSSAASRTCPAPSKDGRRPRGPAIRARSPGRAAAAQRDSGPLPCSTMSMSVSCSAGRWCRMVYARECPSGVANFTHWVACPTARVSRVGPARVSRSRAGVSGVTVVTRTSWVGRGRRNTETPGNRVAPARARGVDTGGAVRRGGEKRERGGSQPGRCWSSRASTNAGSSGRRRTRARW